ncbi:MAG: pyruvate ferredoxin oxidoreductase, partial [Planctomycetales bacterium]|nr:pyruvate ferredoxin oxidoreductase [Planctomycetales bacterium]
MPVELISANHAAALAATLAGRANRTARGFCSGVYPITPSTECMEFLCGQQIEKGKVVRADSEHNAMGICIGASSSGARSFTTTCSNGLAYMVENCVAAAGFRLPIVMSVANRTMGPPWNIWADHGDSLMLRDLGWLQLYSADNQQVFDTVLCAFKLAEDPRVMMPALCCMEGFILSHTTAQVEVPTQGQVDRFLPPTDIPHRLDKSAHTLGQIETPHQTVAHRAQHHEAMLNARQVYTEIQDSFEEVFGRRPADPLVNYCADDADTLIVSMGTLGVTAETVVDQLRKQGQSVGSVRVRMFRPMLSEELRRIFAGKQRI